MFKMHSLPEAGKMFDANAQDMMEGLDPFATTELRDVESWMRTYRGHPNPQGTPKVEGRRRRLVRLG